MPTGYTSPIEDRDDFTFAEYVWRCATAFGAFVMQRDADCGAARPREQMPDQHHEREVTKAMTELARLESLTTEEAQREADAEYRNAKERHIEGKKRERVLFDRYAAMRAEAEAWTPPTEKHAGLREFMISQIDLCLQYINPDDHKYAPTRKRGDVWRAEQIAWKKRDIEYHSEKWANEQQRVSDSNAWVEALVASVPPPDGALW